MSERHTLVHGASRCTVDRHGATVVSWVVAGEERLYLSPRAVVEPGRGIRGGIPVCAPWFGSHPSDAAAPSHGIARTRAWTVAATTPTSIRLVLVDSPATRAIWPHGFRFTLDVTLGADLRVRFTHTNTDPSVVQAGGALHTYLRAVEPVVSGLEDAAWHDKLTGRDEPASGSALLLEGELDRVYAGRPVVTVEHVSGRIHARQTTPDVVVWNPGAEKAADMADLGAGEHRRFVAVEAAVTRPVPLQPGATLTLEQALEVG